MNIAAYPKYQKTDVEWLGDIPTGWTVKRLKWSVEGSFNGVWGDEPDGIDDVVCLRVADFNRDNYTISTEALTLRAIEAKQLESRKLKRGDLLIEKSGGGEKQLVGCVVYFDHEFDAVCSNFVARMPVADGHLPRYWAYVHAGLYAGKLNYPAIKQTTGIQNLDAALYLDTLAAYPPLAEQQQIAAFLDWKTSQIDALIAKKQTLLQKLKEKRLAVITQAVTKGLNPDAPMRDSGISTLGAVPYHWEVRKAKYCCTSIIDCKNRTPEYFEQGEYFVVRTTDVKDGRLNLDEALRTDLENFNEWTIRGAPQSGDVLFTREAPAGEAAVFDGTQNICLGQRMMYFRVDQKKITPEFLLAYIYSHSLQAHIASESGGSTVTHLRLGQVFNLPLLMPPIEEQIDIARHLSTQASRFDQAVENTKSAITRLTEYRSALITAATTGKIDVRNVAIPAHA